MPAVQQKIRTGLIELRTKSGAVYASPTFWERVYLLWTFRNFHSLPRQVLNHRQQELIDKLCRTAVIARRTPGSLIIGSVENVELMPMAQAEIALPPKKLVRMSVPDVTVMPSRAVGSEHGRVASKRPIRAESRVREQSKIQSITEVRSSSGEPIKNQAGARLRWRANKLGGWERWAAVGLCGLAVIGTRLHFQRTQPDAPSLVIAPAAAAVQPSASQSAPAVESTRSNVVQTMRTQQPFSDHKQLAKAIVGDLSALPSAKHERASSSTTVPPQVDKEIATEQPERVQIAEAPESWSYPVAPDSALTGKVSLKAVVAKDGSVTEVDVLSGRRALAQAAARAVKHWRYRAREINGNAVEAVTNIEIKFLGDDAVSISYPAE